MLSLYACKRTVPALIGSINNNNSGFVYYKLSQKREWNTEKYSASASHIQRGRRHMLYFFSYSVSARMIKKLFSKNA